MRHKKLPWYESDAYPRFVGCVHFCRDEACDDTNWCGHSRVHGREAECPTPSSPYDKVCPRCTFDSTRLREILLQEIVDHEEHLRLRGNHRPCESGSRAALARRILSLVEE